MVGNKKSTFSNIHIGRINIFLSIFVLSIIIVFATVYLPKTFNDPNALLNVKCGYPYSFMTFNSNRSLPDYAWTDSCIWWLGEGWYDGHVQFLLLWFLLDLIIVFGILFTSYHVLYFILQKFKGK